ncbi:lysophospholipid acyltransferase family protein [Croceibacterium atlanticum]|uniref:lysophospholipid acyltransferase family protein n=1 Tax=Croceibacterium atlanticum TaxID=1267766 RepID=UPI0006B2F37F|nr:lysophospholipid acyltransferase family protein [Croceibacterium atlanticum]
MLFTLFGRRDLIPPVFLRIVSWLCGLRVRVEGRPCTGTLLMLANHLSWLDILALAGAGRSAFVAKGGLAGHPFLKWLCDQNDTIYVTREKRGTIGRQVEQLRSALAHRRITVFPEGTTGDGTRLLPFKSALLAAVEATGMEVTVQPVALVYEDAEAIAWGDEPGLANIWAILARTRPIRLTIRFLDPLEGDLHHCRKQMTIAAQEAVAKALPL